MVDHRCLGAGPPRAPRGHPCSAEQQDALELGRRAHEPTAAPPLHARLAALCTAALQPFRLCAGPAAALARCAGQQPPRAASYGSP